MTTLKKDILAAVNESRAKRVARFDSDTRYRALARYVEVEDKLSDEDKIRRGGLLSVYDELLGEAKILLRESQYKEMHELFDKCGV